MLDRDLRAHGSYLVIRKGKPIEALLRLMNETGAGRILAEEDYTPYARKRDSGIAASLPLQLILGQTVHHPEFVKKADGRPYTIFTPYSKAWKSILENIQLSPVPGNIKTPQGIQSESIPEFSINPAFAAGEQEAIRRLHRFVTDPIYRYTEDRNRMDLEGTSSLSPYIRFGMLGLRQAVHAARQAMVHAQDAEAKRNAEVWLNELIWREFYIQILYHFPHVCKRAFNPALANIPWRNNSSEFEAWKAGLTGMPIVDAAMRQLKSTGWMHNRARMIVASFLVKDLLIDWCWGEHWFMQNLLDGDIAPNNGGWQWTAGTGTDAAPYFRIFNPVLQSTKFDPEGEYIRKWVPELCGINTRDIHAPWVKGIRATNYPEKPIVEHEIVKQRALNAYNLSRERIKT